MAGGTPGQGGAEQSRAEQSRPGQGRDVGLNQLGSYNGEREMEPSLGFSRKHGDRRLKNDKHGARPGLQGCACAGRISIAHALRGNLGWRGGPGKPGGEGLLETDDLRLVSKALFLSPVRQPSPSSG